MAGPRSTVHPFIDVQRLLQTRGVPVPAIYYTDMTRGLIVLEDLGKITFEAHLETISQADWIQSYTEIVTLLARMHLACEVADPGCIVSKRLFDRELITWELEHFVEWGYEALYGPLLASTRKGLCANFERITHRMLDMPQGFCHRDFQSRNLMYTPLRSLGAWTVLDFQDALMGPRPYDLAALLCDSYISLAPELQTSLIHVYTERMGFSRTDAALFEKAFWWVALQRKLKDAGRFIFIDRERKNPAFLRYYIPSLTYALRALDSIGSMEPLHDVVTMCIARYATSS